MQTLLKQNRKFNYLCMSLNKNELIKTIIDMCNKKDISSSLIHKKHRTFRTRYKENIGGENQNAKGRDFKANLGFCNTVRDNRT